MAKVIRSLVKTLALSAKVVSGVIPNFYIQVLTQELIGMSEEFLIDEISTFPEAKHVLKDDDNFVRKEVEELIEEGKVEQWNSVTFGFDPKRTVIDLVKAHFNNDNVVSDVEVSKVANALERYLFAVNLWVVQNPVALVGFFNRMGSVIVEQGQILESHGKNIEYLLKICESYGIGISNLSQRVDVLEKNQEHKKLSLDQQIAVIKETSKRRFKEDGKYIRDLSPVRLDSSGKTIVKDPPPLKPYEFPIAKLKNEKINFFDYVEKHMTDDTLSRHIYLSAKSVNRFDCQGQILDRPGQGADRSGLD